MNKKILIVEDEKPISEILKFNLKKNHYQTDTAYDGREAIEKVNDFKPDLILLDLMIPYQDGFDVCKKIREKYDTPILVISAKSEETDKILALELGADDYVTKPFSIKELLARVKSNLRKGTITPSKFIKVKDLDIDMFAEKVYKKGKDINITHTEYNLLKFLTTQREKVFSRDFLLKNVWKYDKFLGDIRTVDVTVKRLREKIENDPSNPQYIITKRGVGYYFVA